MWRLHVQILFFLYRPILLQFTPLWHTFPHLVVEQDRGVIPRLIFFLQLSQDLSTSSSPVTVSGTSGSLVYSCRCSLHDHFFSFTYRLMLLHESPLWHLALQPSDMHVRADFSWSFLMVRSHLSHDGPGFLSTSPALRSSNFFPAVW